LLSGYSGAGNQEETVVVEDIAAIARSAFGAIAYSHANGGLFIRGVTAPVRFPANAAWSILGNPTKTIDSNSLPLRKVNDPALVGIGNMYCHENSIDLFWFLSLETDLARPLECSKVSTALASA
jgi:hypothetical protein